ncbi:hypothetical protein COHA_008948 [Chlorella ohadii]|uniref:Uncharacterized protein n=1 Tax=Chlorella ohadii TaxID=2649997 RepID=A0AAD5DGF7_9CHLO|nr:hypothetical protein COHA_008948 [Chlorella ohadii]
MEPTDLAETKYEEAQRLSQEADELDSKAKQAQQEALTVVRQAVEPERTRQERLREAAEAELRAKQLEQEVQLIQGKMERRLAQAEARGETAAVLAVRAERVQEQAHVAAVTAEAAREMEEMYDASRERHAGLAGQLDRVGAEPTDERARELMRAQRERYGGAGVTTAPMVPVDMPPVPVSPGPEHVQVRVMHLRGVNLRKAVHSQGRQQALLAQAPSPPSTAIPAAAGPSAAAAASGVQQVEGAARVPVAA